MKYMNSGFQDTGYQAMNDSDSWKKETRDETNCRPSVFTWESFQAMESWKKNWGKAQLGPCIEEMEVGV